MFDGELKDVIFFQYVSDSNPFSLCSVLRHVKQSAHSAVDRSDVEVAPICDRCLDLSSPFESRTGHERNLPVAWGSVLVSSGDPVSFASYNWLVTNY